MEAYKCDRCGKLFEKLTVSILDVDKQTSEEWWKAGKEQNNDT